MIRVSNTCRLILRRGLVADWYWWYNQVGGLILVLAFVYMLAKARENYERAKAGAPACANDPTTAWHTDN
jgi:hypothetical protein